MENTIGSPSPSRAELFYLTTVSLFCVLVFVSNLLSPKIFHLSFLGDFGLSTGVLAMPLTFCLSNIVNELFGPSRARLMTYIGLATCTLANGLVLLSIHLPPHRLWFFSENPWGFSDISQYQMAFQSVFGLSSISLAASLLAYTIGQLLDVSLYTWIRGQTRGKHLWLRNSFSLVASQLVDTVIANTVLWRGGLALGWGAVWEITFTSLAYKLFVLLAIIPLVYAVVFGVRFWVKMPSFRSHLLHPTGT